MSLTVRSDAFSDGHAIPVRHTEDGDDLSPALSWTGTPKGTVEFALIVDDPDAPRPEPWVHWIVGKIPGDATALPQGFRNENAPAGAPAGLVYGRNTWGTVGYRGPAPPKGHGTHHYHFKLYALDAPLTMAAGTDKDALLQAMSGHVLGHGELVGTYQRP